jgi:predicted nucleic acid-binding protein
MSSSVLSVVCDAGPLIHLKELDCLSLLEDFNVVMAPSQVWREVTHHCQSELRIPNISLKKVDVIISSQARFKTLVQSLSLDLGEQAALSLMQDHPESIFLTDDAAARLAGVMLGYRVHGTIGILLRAIRRRQLTKNEVVVILRNLHLQSTLYIRPNLIKEIITRLENQI